MAPAVTRSSSLAMAAAGVLLLGTAVTFVPFQATPSITASPRLTEAPRSPPETGAPSTSSSASSLAAAVGIVAIAAAASAARHRVTLGRPQVVTLQARDTEPGPGRALRSFAEINNGRLAMVAATVRVAQNGISDTIGPSVCLLRTGAFESELGVQAPVGFFDPAGFTKECTKATFNQYRAAELKHGRLGMMATMGYITPELFGKFPGYLSPSMGLKYADIPNGLAAFTKVPAVGWAQIVGYCFAVEITSLRTNYETDTPGDFGFKVITSDDPEVLKKKLNSELANGRLAMVAAAGMLFQNGMFGTTGPEMWIPGAGAFESELGVQAPVGFFDPLGLSKDGDADTFKRRRAVELKHGRICMLACIGYIIPEYVKFPGYLSPALDVKFADVPNGIAAVSKVPIEGWLQIALFLGHYEGQFFRQDPKRAPGDFEDYGFLGIGRNFIFNFDPPSIADAETRNKKLSAELANGRLAMVAIMAMLFQNGTVGTTGPSMWLPGA